MTFEKEKELYRQMVKMDRHLEENEVEVSDKAYRELREMVSHLLGYFGAEVAGTRERLTVQN